MTFGFLVAGLSLAFANGILKKKSGKSWSMLLVAAVVIFARPFQMVSFGELAGLIWTIAVPIVLFYSVKKNTAFCADRQRLSGISGGNAVHGIYLYDSQYLLKKSCVFGFPAEAGTGTQLFVSIKSSGKRDFFFKSVAVVQGVIVSDKAAHRETVDQLHSFLQSQGKAGGAQPVSIHRIIRDDRNRDQGSFVRIAGSWVQDMVVESAVFFKETFIDPGRDTTERSRISIVATVSLRSAKGFCIPI